MTTRVLVCCDRVILGEGMRALLERHDMKVQVETTLRGSLATATETGPDIMVTVAPLFTLDSIDKLTELARLGRTILLTKPENTYRAFEALRVGVRAVLSAETSVEELVHVIKTITEVNAIIAPGEAQEALTRYWRSKAPKNLRPELTPRETEVLVLLTQGKTNTEMAGTLSVSSTTVRSHVHRVLRKLGAATRAQAVAIAYESGLLGTCPGYGTPAR
ncbi:DNA-binding NarL/FixJ family response regulator [Streptomyces sp. BK208]|uniref:response regulator transcription factor n=1 Tax=Streptomyces sp. BK208 TaxID=2512150 RepID=UPI00105BE289|nr:response regulator transcription factor [Streptomyces sp. BK208]TDT28119.1 DNA-binding NarL/FixJ family response regulator [Streptomyces sp. BK208]